MQIAVLVIVVVALVTAGGMSWRSEHPAAPAVPPPGAVLPPLPAGEVAFGTDNSPHAHDGLCDDRRFEGAGMAEILDWGGLLGDASDCRAAFEAGRVSLWDFAAARARTDCASIGFGDDSGDRGNDGECDDPRFDGWGRAGTLAPADRGADATDCRRLREAGLTAPRAPGG